jgi:hypothetical protein
MLDWSLIYERLKERIQAFGVSVAVQPMRLETTGVFDGLSITTNSAYDQETRCHNIAHSFGHITQWSLDFAHFEALYKTLHAAKENKAAAPEALETALQLFRAYEEEASQYATWLLDDTGNSAALSAFTNFARADIEVIVAFHREGSAPVWQDFFTDWNARVARGELEIRPFKPKPVPPFTPVHISPREVIRARAPSPGKVMSSARANQ